MTLTADLKNMRCGDSGCIYGAEGQCTNGGCQCLREPIRRLSGEARYEAMMARSYIQRLVVFHSEIGEMLRRENE